MKLRSLLTMGLLSASLVLLNSCSKDEAAPKLQFTFDGETYTLKGANIYLTYEANTYNGTHHHRDYYISDGTLIEGEDGDEIDDYTDATYIIEVELATLLESDFGAGEYPQHDDWSPVAPITTNISYINFEAEDGDIQYYTDDETEDFSPVIVSGGMDEGETITLKFNGILRFYHWDGVNETEEDVTGKFFFKGEVHDERVL